jgi:hypothetical protein
MEFPLIFLGQSRHAAVACLSVPPYARLEVRHVFQQPQALLLAQPEPFGVISNFSGYWQKPNLFSAAWPSVDQRDRTAHAD